MVGKELGGNVCLHGFISHGLCPVFTKLERCAVFRVRPCTPRAIKPFVLIDQREGFDGAGGPHFLQPMQGRRNHCRNTGGFRFGLFQLQAVGVRRRSCSCWCSHRCRPEGRSGQSFSILCLKTTLHRPNHGGSTLAAKGDQRDTVCPGDFGSQL